MRIKISGLLGFVLAIASLFAQDVPLLAPPGLPVVGALPTTGVVIGSLIQKSGASAGVYSGAAGNTWIGPFGAAGSTAFSGITSGTNTAAAMLIGTGASLGATGSGTLTATQLTPFTGLGYFTAGVGAAATSANVLGICTTCVTSAASLTANQNVWGAGSQGEATNGDLVDVAGTSISTPVQFLSTLNGALSAPPFRIGGTWFISGGSATTTKPQALIECNTGTTTSTGWNTAGTGLGINACSGFSGTLLSLQVNGSENVKVFSNGTISIASNTSYTSAGNVTFNAGTANSTVTVQTQGWSGTSGGPLKLASSTFTNSSGTPYDVTISPTYNQTSTAGAIDLLINRTETAVGGGPQDFIAGEIAGGSPLFSIDHTGLATFANLTLTTGSGSIPAGSVLCFIGTGAMGYATNTAGVIGTTCNPL